MKEPYIRKYSTIGPITAWIVDGEYVRNRLNIEFSNFSHHYAFPKMIPEHEIWLDKPANPNELFFFLDHALNEYKFMEHGLSYDAALERADKLEKKLRARIEGVHITHDSKDIKPALIKKLGQVKSTYEKHDELLEVWLVKGEWVREHEFFEFVEGGNEMAYKWVPKNMVIIDDDVEPKERRFIVAHEVYERALMKYRNWPYWRAHEAASAYELKMRHGLNHKKSH